MKLITTDPMEQIIEVALLERGINYLPDIGGLNSKHLDFHLVDFDVYIEVKRMHSDRIAAQMARAPNVIAAQGETAVRFLAHLVRTGDFEKALAAPVAA